MNTAARLIFFSPKFQHIAPTSAALAEGSRADCIQVCSPRVQVSSRVYTNELCQVADVEARQRLRSSSSSSLIVSRTRLSTVGDRAFPGAAARVWNSLYDLITSAPSVAVFRSRLKTHLFNISYPPPWLYSARAVMLSCFGHYNRSSLPYLTFMSSHINSFSQTNNKSCTIKIDDVIISISKSAYSRPITQQLFLRSHNWPISWIQSANNNDD